MYIKEKNVEKNYVEFKVAPVFRTEDLVKRCRTMVDDYFTFVNYEKMTENYNFRKYSLGPIYGEANPYLVIGIEIGELIYCESPILLHVFRNGCIIIDYPKNITEENKELFVTRFERMIEYALQYS